jgi:hypothetical protein
MGELGQAVFREVFPIIASAAGVMAVAVLQRLFKRIGLDLTEKRAAVVRQSAENIIVAIEEEARRRLVSGEEVMPSVEKRDQAILRLIEKHPSLKEEDALELLDALLPKVRQIIPGATKLAAPAAAAGIVRRH